MDTKVNPAQHEARHVRGGRDSSEISSPGANGATQDRGRPESSRVGAAVVLLAPVALIVAIAYHPYIPVLNNSAEVARTLEAGPLRWGLAHLAVGLAAALLLLAFIVLRSYLRERGDRWSGWGLPFVVVGSVLFAFLPAMEITVIAVSESGGDVAAALAQMNTWFVPVLVSSGVLFAVGVAGFAAGIVATPLGLGRGVTTLVVVALLVGALTRFVPLSVTLYVGAVALAVALWPLGLQMLQEVEPEDEADRYLRR